MTPSGSGALLLLPRDVGSLAHLPHHLKTQIKKEKLNGPINLQDRPYLNNLAICWDLTEAEITIKVIWWHCTNLFRVYKNQGSFRNRNCRSNDEKIEWLWMTLTHNASNPIASRIFAFFWQVSWPFDPGKPGRRKQSAEPAESLLRYVLRYCHCFSWDRNFCYRHHQWHLIYSSLFE